MIAKTISIAFAVMIHTELPGLMKAPHIIFKRGPCPLLNRSQTYWCLWHRNCLKFAYIG